MKPLRILLADLTYSTVTLSTGNMPLSIGYIAAYCKKVHGDLVDIRLFKYIDDLEDILDDCELDILGLSNYCWNERIGLEFFQIVHEKNPNIITVWGGQNFPKHRVGQLDFLNNRPEVDVYVPMEGEIGFSNLISRILTTRMHRINKSELFTTAVDGCIVNDQRGNYHIGNSAPRIKNLDEIPSPYLTGILDEFFDELLFPQIQTNRGCPFTCTFCADGSALVNKVNKFSLKRVTNELQYIGQHVKPNIGNLDIADLNFGMYSRDIEICQFIHEYRIKHGYPSKISTTTGKNSKEKIAKAIKILQGTLAMSMSVQSMDDSVLENIGRKNISASKMLEIMKDIGDVDIGTLSEVIIGLPGDSFDSCVRTVEILFNAGVDNIQMYTLMLLDGSELNTPQQREKWGFKTKWRILPRDFVQLRNGKRVLEIEEVVVSSNTLDFGEYLHLREIALIIWVVSYGILFDPVRKLLSSHGIKSFDLIMQMYKRRLDFEDSVTNIFRSFREATKDELWDDPNELIDHYQKDLEWNKLLQEEAGNNVIQYFHAQIISEAMASWVRYTVEATRELLVKAGVYDCGVSNSVDAIEEYCLSMSYKIFEADRPLSITERFDFDIIGWLVDKGTPQLSQWQVETPIDLEFLLTENQYQRVENEISIYGSTNAGMSQVVKCLNTEDLWRRPLPAVK